MSHDQKPPRVRVVKNGGAPEQRRRDDRGPAAVAILDGEPAIAPAIGAASGRVAVVLGAAFMLAAGAGGILVALLAPS
jgi:hypothetical protein